MLQSHYRAPLNFSNNSLLEANTSLSSLYRSVEDLSVNGDPDNEILTNLEDDVNTPKVFSRLHYLSEQANKGSIEAAQLLKNSSLIDFNSFATGIILSSRSNANISGLRGTLLLFLYSKCI